MKKFKKILSQENYWLSQNEETFDGVDALAIKSRPNELDAYILEGHFSGAFTIKFKWKAERPDRSIFQFRIRDVVTDEFVAGTDKSVSGMDWEEVSTTILNPSDYRISWVFATVYQPEVLSAWLDQIEVHTHDAYEVWTFQNFSDEVRENLGDALASTDSDGDGIPNQLEWAMLSDPNQYDSPLDFQVIEKEGEQYAAFSFSENPTLENYEIVMETSTNLKTWTEVTPIAFPSEANEEKMVWQDPVSLESISKRFLRLKAQSKSN